MTNEQEKLRKEWDEGLRKGTKKRSELREETKDKGKKGIVNFFHRQAYSFFFLNYRIFRNI